MIEKLLQEFKTYKERTENELYINLSDGNKKLISNKRVSFLIWNLPARITCPYATKHCIDLCYAGKAEKAYPTCLPSRMDHFTLSKQSDFVQRMIYTILVELD